MEYANVSVKFPKELDREVERFLDETGVYTNKSEFIKESVRRNLMELHDDSAIAALRIEQLLARAERNPLSDEELHDCVLLRRDGLWWALAGGGGALYAYHSRTLAGDDWTPHRENPVVTGRPEAVCPAGRPIATDDGAIVFFQDCSRRYGERVWAYEVTHLTATDYRDERVGSGPVLGPAGGVGWNSGRMHHLDAWLFEDRWLCAVDGNIGLGKPVFGDHWAIGFYEQRH